jgi:hypothetical protein
MYFISFQNARSFFLWKLGPNFTPGLSPGFHGMDGEGGSAGHSDNLCVPSRLTLVPNTKHAEKIPFVLHLDRPCRTEPTG